MLSKEKQLEKVEALVLKIKKEIELKNSKIETITINNIEYELKQHDNNKMLSEIIIPKGWRLLLPSEAMMLYERNLIDNTFWFYVQQTNKIEKENGNVAGFDAGSGWAGLNCYWAPSDSDDSLGVILCKDLKVKR
jgi:hypothetical protein